MNEEVASAEALKALNSKPEFKSDAKWSSFARKHCAITVGNPPMTMSIHDYLLKRSLSLPKLVDVKTGHVIHMAPKLVSAFRSGKSKEESMDNVETICRDHIALWRTTILAENPDLGENFFTELDKLAAEEAAEEADKNFDNKKE